MKKKKYKHIFFDLDNTLWDFNRNSKLAMQQAFEKFNIGSNNIGFETFYLSYSRHNKTLWKAYRNKTISKNELIVKRFQNTFDELQIGGADPKAVNTFYLRAMPESNLLVDGALDLLKYLNQKHYTLYIITNGFKEVQNKKLEGAGILHFFKRVYISEVLKLAKPAHELFAYAIKSANAKKNESLMVGDDWEADILGALNFGIDAVFFTQLAKPVNNSKNTLYLVHVLGELTKIL